MTPTPPDQVQGSASSGERYRHTGFESEPEKFASSFQALCGDLHLMCQNAQHFNRKTSEIYKNAVRISKVVSKFISKLASPSDAAEEPSSKRKKTEGCERSSSPPGLKRPRRVDSSRAGARLEQFRSVPAIDFLVAFI